MRELVYYVAVSLDGFIAAPDGAFDAFPVEGDHMNYILSEYADAIPTDIAAQLGVQQQRTRFGTVLMGADTYAAGLPMMPSPYRHLEQIVFTHRGVEAPDVTALDADPVEVVRDLKTQEGADIWLCGGGRLAGALRGEIDRLVLKRNPVAFGAGIPLFDRVSYDPVPFERIGALDFESGVSVVEYVRG